MTLGADLYQGTHQSQFDGGPFDDENCTPASLADLIRAMSQGQDDRTGSEVRSLVRPDEETNPTTPGWSLNDADLAASRAGVALTVQNGATWSTLLTRRNEGRFLLVQGMSSVFTSGCSANFDGGHCVALPPLDHSDGRWRLGDPICQDWRWELESKLEQYAAAFAGAGRANFAYSDRVPPGLPDTSGGDDAVTIVTPIGSRTGHVYTNGAKVDIWTPDGIKKSVTLDAVKADDVEYAISQSDDKAPKGGPFRRLAEKPHAGYYVASAVVQYVPPPPDGSGDVVHTISVLMDGAKKAEFSA